MVFGAGGGGGGGGVGAGLGVGAGGGGVVGGGAGVGAGGGGAGVVGGGAGVGAGAGAGVASARVPVVRWPQLLAKVVDIGGDGAQLRPDITSIDELALDSRSTRTLRLPLR